MEIHMAVSCLCCNLTRVSPSFSKLPNLTDCWKITTTLTVSAEDFTFVANAHIFEEEILLS